MGRTPRTVCKKVVSRNLKDVKCRPWLLLPYNFKRGWMKKSWTDEEKCMHKIIMAQAGSIPNILGRWFHLNLREDAYKNHGLVKKNTCIKS